MSTRCWIGADTETGIKAVHVQCDGDIYAEEIPKLVAEHGVDKVVSTLLKTAHPWECFFDFEVRPEYTWYHTDRYEIVPGFGVKFNVDQPPPEYYTTKDRIRWDIEYVYVISADGKSLRWCSKGVTKGDRTWRTQDWKEVPLLPE